MELLLLDAVSRLWKVFCSSSSFEHLAETTGTCLQAESQLPAIHARLQELLL